MSVIATVLILMCGLEPLFIISVNRGTDLFPRRDLSLGHDGHVVSQIFSLSLLSLSNSLSLQTQNTHTHTHTHTHGIHTTSAYTLM